MSSQKLSHAPLVEAIFEVHWKLKPDPDPTVGGTDPYAKVLLGRLYDRLQTDYKVYEALPAAGVPDQMVNFAPQHQFRVAEKQWPLVQLGPGILTLNDTHEYDWPDFRRRSTQAIAWLYEAYPDAEHRLEINDVRLRYIDAIPLSSENSDFLDFMARKMGVEFRFPEAALVALGVSPKPLGMKTVFSYPATLPIGLLQLEFSHVLREGNPIILWETTLRSHENAAPSLPGGFESWLDQAHNVTHSLFFSMIDGELLEQFR